MPWIPTFECLFFCPYSANFSYRLKIKRTHKTTVTTLREKVFGSRRFGLRNCQLMLRSVSLPIFGSTDWSGRSFLDGKQMGVSNVAMIQWDSQKKNNGIFFMASFPY